MSSYKRGTGTYRSEYQDMVDECEELEEWIKVLRRVSDKRFCTKHHQHRCEEECLELIESMISYERHLGSTQEEKEEKL